MSHAGFLNMERSLANINMQMMDPSDPQGTKELTPALAVVFGTTLRQIADLLVADSGSNLDSNKALLS